MSRYHALCANVAAQPSPRRGKRGRREGMAGLPTGKRFHHQLAEALFAYGDRFAALRAADGAAAHESGEDHVLKGLTVPQRVPRPLFGHAVDHFGGGRLGLSGEVAETVWARKFDLHGQPLSCEREMRLLREQLQHRYQSAWRKNDTKRIRPEPLRARAVTVSEFPRAFQPKEKRRSAFSEQDYKAPW